MNDPRATRYPGGRHNAPFPIVGPARRGDCHYRSFSGKCGGSRARVGNDDAPAQTAKQNLRCTPYAPNVLEPTDREIVRLLSNDGRMSYTDLGRSTGLSVSAVHQRVRRLEQRGVITAYIALIDATEIDLPLTAFVSIKPIDPSQQDDAPERLRHILAIEACHSVAGEENYLLKVRVASPADLEALLMEIRAAANVSTRTMVVLSTAYEGRPPAL